MQGQLSDTSVADVLRAHCAEGLTGSVVITAGEEIGTVWLREGRIVGAEAPHRPARLGDRLVGAGLLEPRVLEQVLEHQRRAGGNAQLGAILVEQELLAPHVIRRFLKEQTLDALLELSGWRTGRFELRQGQPPAAPEVPFALTAPEALAEVARRSQEWEELSRTIPDLDVVPFVEPASQGGAAALEPDEFAVLTMVDGESSVRDLAEELGYGEFEAARIVYALVSLGMVRIGAGDEERPLGGAASAPPHHDVGRTDPVGEGEWRGRASAQEDDSDVAELLRELSWLSRGGRGDAPPPPMPAPRQETEREGPPTVRPSRQDRQAEQDEHKRRRRGLFGRR